MRRLLLAVSTLVVALVPTSLHARERAERVADLNPGPDGSVPYHLTVWNGQLYFQATDGVAGAELWRLDGDTPVRVVDILPGPGHGSPFFMTPFAGTLYFQGTQPAIGNELFKLEGGVAVLVDDIRPGGWGSAPSYLTVLGESLYLWKFRDQFTAELAVLTDDGVVAVGPQLAGAPDITGFDALVPWNGALYLSATADAAGDELARFDGVTYTRVSDLVAGAGSSNPSELTVWRDKLFFVASSDASGRELFRYAPATGVELAADLSPGPDSSALDWLTPWQDLLYFACTTGPVGAKRRGLCVHVPGESNVLVPDREFDRLHVHANALYFASSTSEYGKELWKYDGVSATLVADLWPGAFDGNPQFLTSVGNTMYFTAQDAGGGYELWRMVVEDEVVVPPKPAPYLVKDIALFGNSATPYELTALGDRLYFVARPGEGDAQLWRSDGTSLGTVPLSDLAIDYPQDLEAFDAKLYFLASEAGKGRELYVTDNLATSTLRLTDLGGEDGAIGGWLTPAGDRLYFAADDGETGMELWQWRPGVGAALVKDIYPGEDGYGRPFHANPMWLRAIADTVYFTAFDGEYERIWRATAGAATVLSAPLEPAGAHSLVAVNNRLYCDGRGDGTGEELWFQDGGGMALAGDLMPGEGSSWPTELTWFEGLVYFSALGMNVGIELYTFEPNSRTIALAADIVPTADRGSEPSYLTVVGDTLFFRANDLVNGIELWKLKDGVASMVKDICPGECSSQPFYLKAVEIWPGKELLVFSADDGTHGKEVWVSDGTDAGTWLVADLNPGPDTAIRDGGHYRRFVQVDDRVFFQAFNEDYGSELWAVATSVLAQKAAGGELPAVLPAEASSASGVSGVIPTPAENVGPGEPEAEVVVESASDATTAPDGLAEAVTPPTKDGGCMGGEPAAGGVLALVALAWAWRSRGLQPHS